MPPGSERHETRNDKHRLHGGYVGFVDMESTARVCLWNDAGDCKYIVGHGRFALCVFDFFCNKQCEGKVHARFGRLYRCTDFAWNLF